MREESENVIKTEAIEALLNSTKPASTEHILLVSTYIGEGWRSLPRKLDYVEAQIDQFFETHIFKGVKEVCLINTKQGFILKSFFAGCVSNFIRLDSK